MDLLNKIQQVCKDNNIKPARSRGQNFLINENIYDKIVKTAGLKKDDVVLEVGSGSGFLTEKLAEKVKKVIAVELDDKLADLLRVNLKEKKINNVEVVNENILDVNFESGRKKELSSEASELSSWQRMNYKIVANLPYNITSVFLRKFLSSENKPNLMVLMLQKEVAERIVAKPGKMSLLAVSVQFYAEAEIVKYVPRTDFWPVPAVDSAIIKLKVKEAKPLRFFQNRRGLASGEFEKKFFQLLKIGFSSKRKMLKNNLANGYHIGQKQTEDWLKRSGFNEKIRAQEMSVDDWVFLLGHF